MKKLEKRKPESLIKSNLNTGKQLSPDADKY